MIVHRGKGSGATRGKKAMLNCDALISIGLSDEPYAE
jgi:hypothetical protein